MSDDIAIVGAGPSGAWAAYTLARRGARVTLVDPSHPREKPCGGGLTGRALALVAEALPDPLQAVEIRSARFVDSRSGQSARVPLDGQALAVASRAEFDGRLVAAAERAGATLVASRVRDVAVDGSGVRLELDRGTLRASRLIGADGANSLVRRRLARPFTRRQLSIATGYFAHGVSSDEVVVEMEGDPPGYLWSFPRPTHLAVGICAQADAGTTAGALQSRAAAWIRDTGLAPGARLEPYSWPIPSLDAGDLGRLVLAGPRWSLVGDAAGLVDPITREGIYFALLSGQYAADAVTGAPWTRYVERVRDTIAPELAAAARLRAGFFHPRFTGLLIEALQHSAAVRAVMADLVAGRQSYASLRRRLLKTFEIGLAWRLLRTGRRQRT